MAKTITVEQMELLELLKLQWKDEKMVKHCFTSSEYLKHEGKFIDIADKKPSITKTIWYDDETEAPTLTEEMFVKHNMRVNSPKPMKNLSYHGDPLIIITQYCNDRTDGNLCGLTYDSIERYEGAVVVSNELLNEINRIKQELAVKYEKRLRSYYKRYNKSIRVSGYWVNR